MTEYWQAEKYFYEPVSKYPSMWRTLPNSQVSRQSSSASPCDTAKTPITGSDIFWRSSLAMWGTGNLDWILWNSFPVLTVVRFSSTPRQKTDAEKSIDMNIYNRIKKLCWIKWIGSREHYNHALQCIANLITCIPCLHRTGQGNLTHTGSTASF